MTHKFYIEGDNMIEEDEKEIKITKAEMEAYEYCRKGGITNMFNIRKVEELTGLDEDKIIYIMKHYSELMKKYNISRE